MNKFENVDVFATLNSIMRQNTAYYRNDLKIVEQILTGALQSSIPEDKTLSATAEGCPKKGAERKTKDMEVR